MTMPFDCALEMVEWAPGVVHVDGTARPQLVERDTAPDFHAILNSYHALTEIPSLVNASFNRHEEPIVCSPGDALRVFHLGRLEWLALDDYFIRGNEPPPPISGCRGGAPDPMRGTANE